MQSILFLVLALIVIVAGTAYYWRSHQRRRQDSRPQRAMSDEDYNAQRQQDQRRVDDILDKISQKGIESLSKEERSLLDNYR